MSDEKEQLFRDVNPKKQLEETTKKVAILPKEEAAEVVVEIVEEPITEVVEKKQKKHKDKKKKSKEKLAEEPEVEETEEEEPEVVEEVIEDEQVKVKEEIEKTKEELSMLKEARDELVDLYAKYSDLKVSNEKLMKTHSALIVEKEQLSNSLTRYKEIEEQRKHEEKLSRLTRLSANFLALGQIKSVEQLSGKDDEVIGEFEKITEAALDKISETSDAPAETIATQTESVQEATSDVEKSSDVVAKEEKTTESLSDKKFFSNLCTTLTGDQIKAGKRTTFF